MTSETTSPPPTTPSRRRFARPLLIAVAAVAAVAVLAAVYGIVSSMRNPADAACGEALAKARAIAPFAHGEVAALQVAKKLGAGKRVVTIIPDSAERYLSKKIFEGGV